MNRIWSAKITLPVPMLLALMLVLVGLLAFNNTPTAHADAFHQAAVPPVNQNVNAKYVNSIQASKLPAANKLLPLNAAGKFPLSVIPHAFGQTWSGAAPQGLEVLNTLTGATAIGLSGQVSSTQGGSTGVYGTSSATSGAVFGVVGQTNSAQGAGVRALGAGPSTTALQIDYGGIQVKGAGEDTSTPAFVHVVTSSNRNCPYNNCTIIDNPLTNDNPNAILIVTHNFNPGGVGGVYDDDPINVVYLGNHWEISHGNITTALPIGDAFNVLVIKP